MSVTAIVVTHDRPELLQQVIVGLDAQTRRPERILVVDTASAAATTECLSMLSQARSDLEVLRLSTNVGGAGGFAAGLEHSLRQWLQTGRHTDDWAWLMDDDAVPEPDCLERLLAFASAGTEPWPFVAPIVLDAHGDLGPRNRAVPSDDLRLRILCARHEGWPVRAVSFVGPLIRLTAASGTHLPLAEFFIWHDDTEYTARLASIHHGAVVANAGIRHHTTLSSTATFVPSRTRLSVRNLVWCVRERHGSALSTREWMSWLVGGAIRPVRSAPRHQRLPALRAVIMGLIDGLRRAPTHREVSLFGLLDDML